GHGDHSGNNFYLLPKDADVFHVDSETAVNIVQRVQELFGHYSSVDGLVLLLDTCYSGVAAAAASSAWVRELEGRLRFEVLTAAADRPAANACFSRSLVDLIRNGFPEEASNTLRCEVLRKELEQRCPNQVPQLPSWNPEPG